MANDLKAKRNAEMRGRTPEQQTAIKYFYNLKGCFEKTVTDEEYDALVRAKANSINFKQKALNKIGLDESEVNEIEPVHFEGFDFSNPKKIYVRMGADGKYRSSAYQISWIFFSATQVYAYQYTFNMDEDGKKEYTEEYFYRDITNFSTTTDSEEFTITSSKGGCFGGDTVEHKTVDMNRFALSAAGGKFYCSMEQNAYTDRAIQGMKAKLREKKNF